MEQSGRAVALAAHEEELRRHRRAVGWAFVVGAVPAAWAASALGAAALTPWSPVGAIGILTAAACGATWLQLRWRSRELKRQSEQPPATARPPRAVRAAVGALALVLLLWTAEALGWLTAGHAWTGSLLAGWVPDSAANAHGWVAGGFGVAALLAALLAPYLGGASRAATPESGGLACWFRAFAWSLALGSLPWAVRAAGVTSPSVDTASAWLNVALNVLAWLLIGEVVLRVLVAEWRSFDRGVTPPGAAVLTDVFLLRLLASHANPSRSVFSTLAEAFGIDLRGTWALQLARRAALPLAFLLALLGWLASSVVLVPTGHRGVVERFGKQVSETPLDAGLHVGLPWPMQTTQRIDTQRVRSLDLGFIAGEDRRSGTLWDRPHGSEEYSLLLGDGTELVSINAQLQWRVGDAMRFAYRTQNPEDALALLADEALMRRTAGRRLDDVLSEQLGPFADAIHQDIQTACEADELGIDVVDFTLVGLHPPIAVAVDYQDVVSSQIEAETASLTALAESLAVRGTAAGEAYQHRLHAERDVVRTLSEAAGEVAAFRARLDAYRRSPGVFSQAARHTTMRRTLGDVKQGRFAVIDHRFDALGGSIWILR